MRVETDSQALKVSRQLGMGVVTFYQWKRTLGWMGLGELNKLRVLRDWIRPTAA